MVLVGKLQNALVDTDANYLVNEVSGPYFIQKLYLELQK